MYYKTAGFQYDLNKYSFSIFFYEKVHLKLLLFVHGVQSQRSFSTRCQFKMIGCPSILICFHCYQELIFRFLSCLIAFNDSLPCNDRMFLCIG